MISTDSAGRNETAEPRPAGTIVGGGPDRRLGHSGIAASNDPSIELPRRGLLDRDWQKALIVLLTLLAGLALLWVLWQILSPILHTLVQ